MCTYINTYICMYLLCLIVYICYDLLVVFIFRYFSWLAIKIDDIIDVVFITKSKSQCLSKQSCDWLPVTGYLWLVTRYPLSINQLSVTRSWLPGPSRSMSRNWSPSPRVQTVMGNKRREKWKRERRATPKSKA